jgi:hypothetical protein
MAQCYQDAMSVVREYGKPDLFITFTCNPKWDEITNHLKHNQTAADRPDLVARVFKRKLKSLIDDLKSGKAFGPTLAHISVVEFQKRGLPHAHILLILENKINLEDYDKFVSAEIPCPLNQTKLYNLVTTNMVHKCSLNKCLNSEGTCEKRFPKSFADSTSENDNDGYPTYRRRSPESGGKTAFVKCTFLNL